VPAFVIVPLFAFANAGVDLRGGALEETVGGSLAVAVAVAVALLVGKTVGIGGAALLAQRVGIGALPAGVQTRHVWGLAALGGVGFTVPLFVADLAYDAASLTDQGKVGIFAGSLISAVVGSSPCAQAGGWRAASRSSRPPEPVRSPRHTHVLHRCCSAPPGTADSSQREASGSQRLLLAQLQSCCCRDPLVENGVESRRQDAEPQVPGEEGENVAPAVVAVEDARRRDRVRHSWVQVRPGRDDDPTEHGVHRTCKHAP
jgi:hypothetical protein